MTNEPILQNTITMSKLAASIIFASIACASLWAFAADESCEKHDPKASESAWSSKEVSSRDAVRAASDGYTYLQVLKRLDSRDAKGAKELVGLALAAEVLQLENLDQSSLSSEENRSFRAFADRAREYVCKSKNSYDPATVRSLCK